MPTTPLLTLRTLSGSTSPVGAFPFSPQDPRYAAKAQSADFTAIVLHTGGPSLSFHRGLRTVRAGDVHILARGEVHRVVDFGRAEGVAVALQLERFAADLAPRLDALPEVVRPAAASFGALLQRARSIHAEATGGRPNGAVAALAHAQLFLVELLRDAPELPATSVPVRQALTYLERHHHRPVSLRDAASAVHCSSRHLSEKVRRETGQSLGDWLRLFRLAHARALLRDTDLAMEEVALEVGYADVTHFIRTFRRDERVTPAKWRRAARSALQPPQPGPRARTGSKDEAP